jgi:hypothetical protein
VFPDIGTSRHDIGYQIPDIGTNIGINIGYPDIGMYRIPISMSSSYRPGRSTMPQGGAATETLIYLWIMSGMAVSF